MPSNNGKKKRGRKTRTMPHNVLGYNLSQGSKNRIHLRLRHPKNHTSFYPWEDIAGTMCHELAHCEIGPHNAKFYKLMDEIMEQHALFMVRGVVLDQSGFPMGSISSNHDAHVLGGSSNDTDVNIENINGDGNGNVSAYNGNSARGGRKEREQAARNRLQRKKLGLGGTFRLGEGGFAPVVGSESGSRVASLKHLPPAEAARRAAERRVEERRSNDGQFCLPCQDVIEILDGSSSDEEEGDSCDCLLLGCGRKGVDTGVDNSVVTSTSTSTSTHTKKSIQVKEVGGDEIKPNPRINDKGKANFKEHLEIVILDSASSDDSNAVLPLPRKSVVKRPVRKKKTKAPENNPESDSSDVECSSWSCAKCTFHNDPQCLSCHMCGHEHNRNVNKAVIQKVLRDDVIEEAKKTEVEKSMKEYGGFNIYGNGKQSSATLNHLT